MTDRGNYIIENFCTVHKTSLSTGRVTHMVKWLNLRYERKNMTTYI